MTMPHTCVRHTLPHAGATGQSQMLPGFVHSVLGSGGKFPDEVGTCPPERGTPVTPGAQPIKPGSVLCTVSAHYVMFSEDIIYMLNAHTMQKNETELSCCVILVFWSQFSPL